MSKQNIEKRNINNPSSLPFLALYILPSKYYFIIVRGKTHLFPLPKERY